MKQSKPQSRIPWYESDVPYEKPPPQKVGGRNFNIV